MTTSRASLKWDRFPWYPILFAVYAPVALLANNLGQVEMREGVRSILVTLLIAVMILLLARLMLKDWLRAGLASAVVVVLLVSYGHVYNLVKNAEIAGLIVGRHRYLMLVWLALGALALWWIARTQFSPSVTSTMNIVGLVLLLYPTFQIVSYAFTSSHPGYRTPRKPRKASGKYLPCTKRTGATRRCGNHLSCPPQPQCKKPLIDSYKAYRASNFCRH